MTEFKTYTPREVAKMFGVSINTIYDELKAGRLPHMKFGSKNVIEEEDITKWRELKRKLALEASAAKPAEREKFQMMTFKPKKLDVKKMFKDIDLSQNKKRKAV